MKVIKKKIMNLEKLFQILWNQYSTENPSVGKIHRLFEKEGETIVNDHIAFRTINDERVGIKILARPFIEEGYHEAGEYHFPEKKLFAKHFEKKGYPRVFISELILSKFSEMVRTTLKKCVDSMPDKVLKDDHLIASGNVFGVPSFHVYEQLRKESEYAAWVYAFGYRANHFTISVNHLNNFDSLEKLNNFLKANGFRLNNSGGEIKGTPGQLLEQSSTLADRVLVEFTEGRFEIPSCYYEFAKRYPDASGNLFSGFIAGSADKIFESTNYRK